MSDILVEIPNSQLPELAALYESRASWAPHMSTLVHTGIKWKRSDKYKDSITFLSPRNSWEEDGTLIVLVNVRPVLSLFAVFNINCSSSVKTFTSSLWMITARISTKVFRKPNASHTRTKDRTFTQSTKNSSPQ